MCNLKEIKEIFYKYRIYKLRIVNSNYFFNFDKNQNDVDSEELLKEWTSYTDLIDKILSSMEQEYSLILKKIFLENENKKNLNYSDSTYYWKLKQASIHFFKFLKI